MARRPPTAPTNGHTTKHIPGVYWQILRQLCEQRVYESMSMCWLLASGDPESLEKWEAEHAERMAAELAERAGKPLRVRSSQLPKGLPPPFEKWPRGGGGQRSFIVTADDQITLRTTQLRSA